MRREVKTYEWVCDRCGVVEETTVVMPSEFSKSIGTFGLPSDWRETYEQPELPRTGGNYIYQATIRHLCGRCS